jgi:hypothetical protein
MHPATRSASLSLLLVVPTFAQDDCSTATVISGTGTWPYDRTANTSSGFDGGDPALCAQTGGPGAPERDVFWSWTAVAGGNYQIDNCGEGLDTEMNLHLGGDCSATCLLNNDDGGCGGTGESQIWLLGAPAGQTYLIQVGDWGTGQTATAVGQLNILPLPPSPGNDDCSTPDAIAGLGVFPYDRSYATSSGFDGGDPGVCAQASLGVGPPSRDVFFAWTATAGGDFVFDNCTEGANTGMNVHVGSDCTATCLTTNDDGPCSTMGESAVTLLGVTSGDVYLVQLGNWHSWDGAGNIGLLVVTPAVIPSGNDCSTAIPATGVGSFPYDRTLATSSGFTGGSATCESAENDQAPYRDIFFAWTAASSGQFRLDSCGDGVDTTVNLYDGSDCTATCLLSGDGSPCAAASEGSVSIYNVQLGDTFLVQIGDWSSNANLGGTGSLNAVGIVPPPANDTCASPTAISGFGSFAYDRTDASSSGFDGGDPVTCATGQAAPPSRDVFFAWTATVAGNVTFDNCGEGNDTVMNVHVGADCAATCLASNDLGPCATAGESLVAVTGVQVGDVYLVQIGDWSASNFAAAVGNLNVGLAIGPPLNDTCATPEVISGTGTWPYDRSNATTTGFNGGNPVLCQVGMAGIPPQNDVFFAWTSTGSGTFQFDNCGDGVDTQMTVHLGGDCSATCVASNVTGPCGVNGESTVVLGGVATGATYLIQIGGWNNFQFPVPGNLNVTAAATPPANDTCATPTVIADEGSFAYDVTDATTSGFDGGDSAACSPALGGVPVVNDTFYLWTSSCGGTYSFSTCTLAVDTALAVHAGSDCSATCILSVGNGTCSGGGFASEFSLVATAGAPYLVQVGSWNYNVGAGNLDVTRVGGPCPMGAITITCDPASPHYLGGSADLSTSSFGSGTGSDLHLECVGGPAGEFGFFLVSATATGTLTVFNGVLCLDAPQGRYNPQVATNQGLPQLSSVGQFDAGGVLQNLVGTSTSGSGFDVPLELPFSPPGQTILSGSTWNFTCWYRDQVPPLPNPGSSANFSNVAEVTFP